MEEKLRTILENWFDEGCSTWQYRGAPGQDGRYGGSFHHLGDLKRESDGTFEMVIDFGSANVTSALDELSQRLLDIQYICELRGEYYLSIIPISLSTME